MNSNAEWHYSQSLKVTSKSPKVNSTIIMPNGIIRKRPKVNINAEWPYPQKSKSDL